MWRKCSFILSLSSFTSFINTFLNSLASEVTAFAVRELLIGSVAFALFIALIAWGSVRWARGTPTVWGKFLLELDIFMVVLRGWLPLKLETRLESDSILAEPLCGYEAVLFLFILVLLWLFFKPINISWFLRTCLWSSPIFFFLTIPGEDWIIVVSMLGSWIKFILIAVWLSLRCLFLIFSLLFDLLRFEDFDLEKPVVFRFLLEERDWNLPPRV